MLYFKKNNDLHCGLGEVKNEMAKYINAYICIVLVFELEYMKKPPFPLKKTQPNKKPKPKHKKRGTTLTCK